MRALADCTGLAVHVAAEPDSGALGSAFIARCVAGLEAQPSDGARWARTGRIVEPDPQFAAPCAERYDRFLALTTTASQRAR
jgi:xylulokinase